MPSIIKNKKFVIATSLILFLIVGGFFFWNYKGGTMEVFATSDCVSGGGVTCTQTMNGGYTINTYTYSTGSGPTTWMVPTGVTSVQYLVVGGGGGGANGGYYYSDGNGTGSAGGGGGAGGVMTGLAFPVSDTISIQVGAGGALGSDGVNGGNSVFSSITAIGGGGGGSSSGHNGGSGGGGCSANNSVAYSGGSGTSGQGYAGGTGNSVHASWSASGGGGGAGGAGGSNTNNYGAPGGNGVYSTITGSSVGYGAGGVGSSLWGGTNNSYVGDAAYGWGIAGRGYGGNGGSNTGTSGGSGIVIIKYTTLIKTITSVSVSTSDSSICKVSGGITSCKSGQIITFNSVATGTNPIKLYVCKDSTCTNCGIASQTNCWAVSSATSVSNPSATYNTSAGGTCGTSTNGFWAQVCDTTACSSIISQ